MNPWAAAYTWYLRRPEHPAKRRLERVLARALPADGIVADVSHGVRLRLRPSDWIEYVLLRDGTYEPLTLTFLERNLAPGDGVVLAGVNFGLHVVIASRAVGPLGRVLGADGQPMPGLYAAGEVAGFGGGGVHGYRALEGTFLGGCLFSGRVAGRAAAAAVG